MKKHTIILLCIGHGLLLSMDSTRPTINYRSLLVQIFGIPDFEAETRALIVPRSYPYSNVVLNIAVQARKLEMVTRILESESNPDTISEALRLMNAPYMMCVGLTYNQNNSTPVKELLERKLFTLKNRL